MEGLCDRFWSKVDIKGPDECWEWKAYISTKGYGRIYAHNKVEGAHRIAWELTNGPIPSNKLVLHKCDNRKCVNPNHLYLGTHSDNICDAVERKRGNFAFMRSDIGYGNKRFK